MKNYLLMFSLLSLAACEPAPVSPKGVESQKAKAAAASVKMVGNSEIDSLKAKLELTSNPNTVGFILLLNQAGQPILYTSVKGKITSGGKRLTSPEACIDAGKIIEESINTICERIGVAPSDEGTYGSSGEYIFFKNMDGEYFQWNGTYLYSDKPFRTNIQPLVVKIEN